MPCCSTLPCSFTNKSFETDDKDKLLLGSYYYVLERGHYQTKDINDDFSVVFFERFFGYFGSHQAVLFWKVISRNLKNSSFSE